MQLTTEMGPLRHDARLHSRRTVIQPDFMSQNKVCRPTVLNKHNDVYVRWMSQTHAAPHALRAPNSVFHSQERELTGVNQQAVHGAEMNPP